MLSTPTFGAFVYDSADKQMLSTISLAIEQRQNEFVRIAKVRFPHIYFYALRGWYHFPNTCQDLFLSWMASFGICMPIICKLNYSHVLNRDYRMALFIAEPLSAQGSDISAREPSFQDIYLSYIYTLLYNVI